MVMMAKEILDNYHSNLFTLGIGHKSKFLWPPRHPYRLANSIENKGCVLCQTRSATSSQGKLSSVYDLWRYTSQFVGSFLCLGRRGK